MKSKNLKLLLASLLFSFCVQAQPVILHPVVGDTIDLTEKRAYLLFPQFADSTFQYAWIEEKTGTFNLHACLKGGTVTSVMDTVEMDEFKMHIEKLSVYYASQGKPDSTTNKSGSIVIKNKPSGDDKRSYDLTPEMLDKIKREARRYAALNHEAQMQGLTGRAKDDYINTAGHMEITIEAGKK